MSLWNKLFGKKDEPASPPQSAPLSPPRKAEVPPSVPAQPPPNDALLTPKTLSYRKRNITTGPAPFGRQSDLVSPSAGDTQSGGASNMPSTPAPASLVGTGPVSTPPAQPVTISSRPVAAPTIDLSGPLSRREIRVFISSTFRDMQEERELLVKQVFPELRRICDERFVSFTEVDLRWGITEEEAAEGKVLPICLEEIHTCRPYFIGILGERYGWIPDTVPQEVLEKEPWIQEHIGHRTSVTELEILHGVLRNPKMDGHAFFYFRDPAYAAQRGKDFHSEDPDSAAKLATLKETIRHSGRPLVDPYKKPDELAAAVKQQFIKLIDQLYPKEQVPDPLDQEAIGHRTYARRKLLAYVDRPSHSQALSAFVAAPSNGQGLVVTGDSGGGKTALLAAFATSFFNLHPSSFLFEHYFGATPDSASVDGFLRRLLGELKRLADIKDEMPTTSEKMREALPLWLAQTSGGKPIVLVLDALNQIQGDEADRHLNWLPRFFPAHIRVVASSLSGSALDALRERGWAEHLLPLADTAERGQMIDSFLEIYRRKLGDKLRGQVVNAPGTANPLFLRTVLEELRQFGSFEKLPDQVAEYLKATTPQDLFRQVIQRWQQDFHAGRDIVSRSLRHLWAARQGLSENEWLDLLADKSGPMDRQTWRPLLLAMEPHLVQRGSLWAFGHDFLRQAVVAELVPTDEKQQQARHVLADYFENQPVSARTCIELPFQLKHGVLNERLRACLLDIDRFLEILKRDQEELLRYWVWLKEERTMGKPYLAFFENWSGYPGREKTEISLAANALAFFLNAAALYTEAEPLYRRALAIDEASLGPDHPNVARDLNNLAKLFLDTNRYSEAEPLMQRSLDIDELYLKADPLVVASRLCNLSQILKDTNRLSEAERLLRRALAICKKHHGENHPNNSPIINNLAQILQATDRFGEAEPLMKNVLAVAEKTLGPEHPTVAIRLNNIAMLLHITGRTVEGIPLMQRALEINEICFGSYHPSVADNLDNLASLNRDINDLSMAEKLYRRSLSIDERVFGPENPHVAIRQNNLALLLKELHKLPEAELLLRKSLLINERSFGPNNPRVASSLVSIASLFQATSRFSLAEEAMRRALNIDENSFGIDHSTVASDLIGLASILQDTNRLKEAVSLIRRALEIDENVFGLEHHKVASDLTNLAQALEKSNQIIEAERHMTRSLRITENRCGSDHPKTAVCLNNIANLYLDTDRSEEAEMFMRRALLIQETSYGSDHPFVATSLSNFAQLLHQTNRIVEAERHMRRALIIDEKCYGKNHPSVARDLNNLAGLLESINELAEADPLLHRALSINENCYGSEHPEVARSLTNLAQLYRMTNRTKKAIPLIERSLRINEESFGKEHPNTAVSMAWLADIFYATNRLPEAETLIRQALSIWERSYGPTHPNVAKNLNNLASILQDTNRSEEAESLMRRALSIDEQVFGPQHPEVATRLNNLACLLQETNRIGDSEPLMRRAVQILLMFARSTGRKHPHIEAATKHYTKLLQVLGHNQEQIRKILDALE